MDYDAAFRLEENESDFTVKLRGFCFFLLQVFNEIT